MAHWKQAPAFFQAYPIVIWYYFGNGTVSFVHHIFHKHDLNFPYYSTF